MKTRLGLSALLVALTAVAPQAFADSPDPSIGAGTAASGPYFDEPRIMGTYQRCLHEQTSRLVDTLLPGHGQPKTFSDYHNPWVGPAVLEVHQTLQNSNNLTQTADAQYQYHSGQFTISLNQTRYNPLLQSVSNEPLFEMKPLSLPFFAYKSKSQKLAVLGNAHATFSADVISSKPVLMVYPGPDLIPLVNTRNGQPVFSRGGNAVTFDVAAFKSCLSASIDLAFAQPKPTEVVSRTPQLETNSAPKIVAEVAKQPEVATPPVVASPVVAPQPEPTAQPTDAAAQQPTQQPAVVDTAPPAPQPQPQPQPQAQTQPQPTAQPAQ